MVARQRMTRMQRLMRQRRLTREQTLEALNQRARTLGVHDFTLSLRQLDRWLAGDVGTEPRPNTCRVVEAEFGHTIDHLLAADDGELPYAAEGQLRDLRPPDIVDTAARGSSEFAMWADSVRIGERSLASLRARLAALAHDYVNSPLTPVFRELVNLRDDVLTLIKSQPDPSRLQNMYFLAGATCAMLAYASGDLGFPHAATVQAQAALACAEKAGNETLTAWVLGNQAMTSEWYGRPEEGLRFAAEARTHAQKARTPGTVLVRLASIEARAYGRMGRTAAARDAMDRASAARDLIEARYADERDEFDELGGILTFTLAKQHFYDGSTFLRIGSPAAAERTALATINTYANGPAAQRSYGDEVLAWVDVSAARLLQPNVNLDGAAQALDVVHRVPPSLQIPALVQPLSRLRRELELPQYHGSKIARSMREVIDDLRENCFRRSSEVIS